MESVHTSSSDALVARPKVSCGSILLASRVLFSSVWGLFVAAAPGQLDSYTVAWTTPASATATKIWQHSFITCLQKQVADFA
jgi:hypothetical protein